MQSEPLLGSFDSGSMGPRIFFQNKPACHSAKGPQTLLKKSYESLKSRDHPKQFHSQPCSRLMPLSSPWARPPCIRPVLLAPLPPHPSSYPRTTSFSKSHTRFPKQSDGALEKNVSTPECAPPLLCIPQITQQTSAGHLSGPGKLGNGCLNLPLLPAAARAVLPRWTITISAPVLRCCPQSLTPTTQVPHSPFSTASHLCPILFPSMINLNPQTQISLFFLVIAIFV